MSHEIAGARGRVEDREAILAEAREWARGHAADVLLADARAVLGPDHLESAARHAERAQTNGALSTKSVSMETLLYLTGRRQVADAIHAAGLRKGTTEVAVVLFGRASLEDLLRRLAWFRDDSVLRAEGKLLHAVGVSATEEGTVPKERKLDLALEKTALVDVIK